MLYGFTAYTCDLSQQVISMYVQRSQIQPNGPVIAQVKNHRNSKREMKGVRSQFNSVCIGLYLGKQVIGLNVLVKQLKILKQNFSDTKVV